MTACTPDDGDCLPTNADYARLPYPTLGDFLLTYGNYGYSRSNSFQTQIERRMDKGLMFNASYTYLDQKSTGIDQGNSSLGGVPYDPFQPNLDYTEDAWVSHHRFVFYGVYDLPIRPRENLRPWNIEVGGRGCRRMAVDVPDVCQEWYGIYAVLDL